VIILIISSTISGVYISSSMYISRVSDTGRLSEIT
jgi:hypothetical protein